VGGAVEANALTYAPSEPFDAVHCRLVLLHQPAPRELVVHMVALTLRDGHGLDVAALLGTVALP